MWVKLLGQMSIKEGLQPQHMNGCYRQPVIHGRNKAELKKMFVWAGLPWLYGDKVINDPRSPYNRVPKQPGHFKRFELRLAHIAKQLENADEKELQHRKEALAKKQPRGLDRHIMDVLASLGVRDKIVDKNQHYISTKGKKSKKDDEGPRMSRGKKATRKVPKKNKQDFTSYRGTGDNIKRTIVADLFSVL